MGRTGFTVVDCDGHVEEPASLYMEYTDAPHRERIRRLMDWAKGVAELGSSRAQVRLPLKYLATGIGNRPSRRQLGTRDPSENIVPTDPYRLKNTPFGGSFHPWTKPGSGIDPHQSKKDYAEIGIDVSVMFPSGAGSLQAVGDPDLEAALCTAYNRWVADFCSAYPNEFYAVAAIPLLDIPNSVKEIQRVAKEKWCVGVSTSCAIKGKLADHPYFHPIYAELQENDLPLCIHAVSNADATPPSLGRDDLTDSYFLLHMTSHVWHQMVVMSALIGGGTLEKFPRLRIAHLESGCGWLPYWSERLDIHHERLPESVPFLTRKPSEHLKGGRIFMAVEGEEATVPMVAQLIGEEMLVFASDYPHYDSDLPGVVDAFAARSDLTPLLKRKILNENAYRLYTRIPKKQGLEAAASKERGITL